MKRTINWILIRWRAIDLDRKVELFLVFGGLVIAVVVMMNGGSQLEQMKKQTEFMQSQLTEMKASGEETRRAITALENIAQSTQSTIEQSKVSLDANMDAFRLDTRPWVGHSDIVLPREANGLAMNMIKMGNLPVFSTKLHNYGRSPAMSVELRLGSHITKSSDKFIATYGKRPATSSKSAIWPGAFGTTGPAFPSVTPLTEEQVTLIKSGELIIYYYGEVSYKDIFGKRHVTTFCTYLSSRHGGMSDCHSYNEAT